MFLNVADMTEFLEIIDSPEMFIEPNKSMSLT